MFRAARFLRGNKIYQIAFGEQRKNGAIFLCSIFLGLAAASLEGVSFLFILGAFSTQESGMSAHSGWLRVLTMMFPDGIGGNKIFFFSVVIAIGLQVLRTLVCYINTWICTRFALSLQTRLLKAIYQQILKMSYGYISRLKIGDLLDCARIPVNFVVPLIDALNKVAVSIFTGMAIAGVMFFMNAKLTVFTLCISFCALYLQRTAVRAIIRASSTLSKQAAEVNQDTSQMLQGIKLIHTYFQHKTIWGKIEKGLNAMRAISSRMYIRSQVIQPINEMISIVIVGMILCVSVFLIGAEDPSFVSIVMTFLLLSYRLSTRVQIGVGMVGLAGTHFGSLQRVHEMLETKGKEFIRSEGEPLDARIEEIAFEHVSFSYPGSKVNVLSDIHFKIFKGQVVGIVGLSGSGKTSLIDLLLRLYEPVMGEILVNQKGIRQFSLDSWRIKFGVVTQDSFLFDDTVEENIRFGSSRADSEAICEAAKLAESDPFIQKLPSKYQTVLGERGVRLSGGERQRISLARAFLRNAEILILDEATSHLDSETEFYIQKSLDKVRGSKTIVIIAHRLSTVMHADQIFVMQQGSLLEAGTHESLLREQGRYFHLWNLQAAMK